MGTRSSLENFNSNRTEYTTQINRPGMQSRLQTIQSGEKALSMNSINEQSQSEETHHRNGSVCSTDGSTSTGTPEPQQPRPQRPRSAPGSQSADTNTHTQPRIGGRQLHVPSLEVNGITETRRMAVCEANDDAENARRRMRVYKKRF